MVLRCSKNGLNEKRKQLHFKNHQAIYIFDTKIINLIIYTNRRNQ